LGLSIAALLLAGLGGSGLVKILFGNRLMVSLGLCSYSIYLWHFPLLNAIAATESYQSLPGYRLPSLLAVAIPLLSLVALLSYAVVERPFMRLRRMPRPRSAA
jgi:peptidoglycan/LPS O-acetylase OafA/YrhL